MGTFSVFSAQAWKTYSYKDEGHLHIYTWNTAAEQMEGAGSWEAVVLPGSVALLEQMCSSIRITLDKKKQMGGVVGGVQVISFSWSETRNWINCPCQYWFHNALINLAPQFPLNGISSSIFRDHSLVYLLEWGLLDQQGEGLEGHECFFFSHPPNTADKAVYRQKGIEHFNILHV